MVYCGRPSQACLECRLKRRKCDLSKPSCGQCIRAGANCTGFRDPRSLVIRDQSAQVMHKSGVTQATDTSTVTTGRRHAVLYPSSKSQQILARQSAPRLMYPISLPLGDQPRQFFIHHYILDYSPLAHHNQLSCFQTIYSQAPDHGYLSNAVDAVGMASLANLNCAPHLKHAAYENYAFVLREINLAISNNGPAVSYEMLVTVMLLNVFETVTDDTTSLTSWNKHVGGELALVNLWNLNELESSIGRKIFLQLRDDILISCLQRHSPVPIMMLEWMAEARRIGTDLETPSADLAEIIVQICSLISSANQNFFEGDALSQYVSATFSVERDLETWSSLHKNKYTIAEGTRDHFEECDLHVRLSMIKTYNLYCCSRILLHETLYRVISQHHEPIPNSPSSLPPSLSNDRILIASYTATRDSISNICYNVSKLFSNFGNNQCRKDLVRAGSCLDLIWPLFVAGTAYATTPSEREWISLRLREIGELSGLERANVAASHIYHS